MPPRIEAPVAAILFKAEHLPSGRMFIGYKRARSLEPTAGKSRRSSASAVLTAAQRNYRRPTSINPLIHLMQESKPDDFNWSVITAIPHSDTQPTTEELQDMVRQEINLIPDHLRLNIYHDNHRRGKEEVLAATRKDLECSGCGLSWPASRTREWIEHSNQCRTDVPKITPVTGGSVVAAMSIEEGCEWWRDCFECVFPVCSFDLSEKYRSATMNQWHSELPGPFTPVEQLDPKMEPVA